MKKMYLCVGIVLTVSVLAVSAAAAEDTSLPAPVIGGEEPAAASELALCADTGVPPGPGDGLVAIDTSPEPVFMAGGCSAAADCGSLPDISCSTSSSSATCEFADRECAWGERGFVRCGSSTTYCACPCGSPTSCTHGATRWVQTSQCCSGVNLYKWKEQRCNCGSWSYTGATDCLVACDGGGAL